MSPRHLDKRQAAIGVLLVILTVGLYFIAKDDGAFEQAEERDRPKGALEEVVARKVLEQYADARFERWGPHVTALEMERYPACQQSNLF